MSLATYQSRDGGERGSSPAVEDVRLDRKDGAEGAAPACYYEGGHDEGGSQLDLATIGASNMMDGNHNLWVVKKIHTCASPPSRPGRRGAVEAPNTLCRAREVVQHAPRRATHCCMRAVAWKPAASS
jgi:hypothetical protein